MVRKTIITASFPTARGEYDDFWKVFNYSAKKHMPDAEIICLREVPEVDKSRGNTYAAMSARLYMWADAVKNVSGNIILADVDIVFTGNMFSVFNEYKFDLAYTKRNSKWKPINGGIIFLRDNAKSFIDLWARVNNKMYKNKELHNKWRKKYKGMNQPALGYLIEHPKKHGMNLLSLPCLKYNACDQEWAHITPETKAIHLKRALRKFKEGAKIPRGAEKAITIWKQYAKEVDNG